MQESLLESWFGPSPTIEIPGFHYAEEMITLSDETALIQCIDQEQWNSPYQRRTQIYGTHYDKARQGKSFPPFLQVIGERLHQQGYLPHTPNLLVVNEYLPGQGIGPHIDDDSSGEHVAILSIGSAACMELSKHMDRKQVLLQRRSLCLLHGEARWQWQHAILKRQSDMVNGVRQFRQRRLSLTFRIAS